MLATTLTPLSHFCYVTHMAFAEGVKCPRSIFGPFRVTVRYIFACLPMWTYLKYEVFNTEVYSPCFTAWLRKVALNLCPPAACSLQRSFALHPLRALLEPSLHLFMCEGQLKTSAFTHAVSGLWKSCQQPKPGVEACIIQETKDGSFQGLLTVFFWMYVHDSLTQAQREFSTDLYVCTCM